MTGGDAFSAPPGAFGKLPGHADFILRGLPASFADPWHAWLARGLAAARRLMGARFESAYMVAPVWRFALAPGACGPEAALGILLPSVDAVGRLFPLTLATISPSLPVPLALAAAHLWFQALEEVGREALAQDPEAEAWASHLAGLAPGPALRPAAAQAGGPVHTRLPVDCGHRVTAPAARCPGSAAGGNALLWCYGSPFVRSCALVLPRLPEGPQFARLLCDLAPPPPGGMRREARRAARRGLPSGRPGAAPRATAPRRYPPCLSVHPGTD
ncbi:type VI secretion system-associated protein TagF [Belnapia sp. T6]|uniref:Type VI secretion system-associated protein TagF n=1 Tax=Belnapia mucosa TaxID=2804532 RepID=A0ABS1VAJ3_9PROT|nr:type VI secretion system-associated protein TagF [Belnapia mucosa]MBL6458660.1 type VI secretion system-associated protein TagF [Belnapia mucosa]